MMLSILLENVLIFGIRNHKNYSLAQKAIDELDVNVKLLDLNRFSEYLGYSNEVTGKEAYDLWQELFVPMSNFYEILFFLKALVISITF